MENLKNVAPIEDFNWDAYENGEAVTSASHEELEKAYDVKQIMSDFKGKHGSYPTTIRIKAKTDMDGAKLPEKYTDYTIENFKWNPSNQ